MEELISVIVPIYNVEKYLEKCIKSLLKQTYHNLEILLIDDGSEDGSLSVCQRYAKEDSRICVIHQENQGVAGARNTGLQNVHGTYIGFVDPDDFIHPRMFEVLYSNLINDCSDISVGMYCTYTDFENNSDIVKRENNDTTRLSSRIALQALYESKRPFNSGILCDKLFRSDLFVGLSFSNGKIHEDEMIIYKLFDCAKYVTYTNFVLYYYYMREGSIMRKYSLERIDAISAYRDRMDFFRDKGYEELLEKALRRYLHIIRVNYCAVKKYFPMEQDILSKMKSEHDDTYSASDIHSLAGQVFMKNPMLYQYVNKFLRIVTKDGFTWE